MNNPITNTLNADQLILLALREDITSEDVSTNAVMRKKTLGKVQLICKQDGVICGLYVFERTFKLLDDDTQFRFFFKDGMTELYGPISTFINR